ncbi:MAG: DNA repair protein RecO [Planctomycetota bacterium]
MARIKDSAICIRDLDWSETSQIVVLLTEQHGKVRGLAKGSRRASPSAIAKFSGGINLLNAGQVMVSTRRGAQLAAVTEWDLQDDHYHLRNSLRAQRVAMYAADLCGAMLADEDPHPGTYHALAELLATVADVGAIEHALLRFQWRVLSDCGFKPELDLDVQSGGELAPARAYTFDPSLGGLTSRDGLGDERWRVRGQTVGLLRAVAGGGELADAEAVGLGRANRLLGAYARALLDKELATYSAALPG